MPGRHGHSTKTHYLKNADLGSLLQPADPAESDFTATKGEPCNSARVVSAYASSQCAYSSEQFSALYVYNSGPSPLFIAVAYAYRGRATSCLTKVTLQRHGTDRKLLGYAVVVTIGPSCQDVDTLCQLLKAGATCARCDLTVQLTALVLPV